MGDLGKPNSFPADTVVSDTSGFVIRAGREAGDRSAIEGLDGSQQFPNSPLPAPKIDPAARRRRSGCSGHAGRRGERGAPTRRHRRHCDRHLTFMPTVGAPTTISISDATAARRSGRRTSEDQGAGPQPNLGPSSDRQRPRHRCVRRPRPWRRRAQARQAPPALLGDHPRRARRRDRCHQRRGCAARLTPGDAGRPDVAEGAGRIRRETGLRLPDALIAATAIAHDLQLATRNGRDFERVRG